MCRHIGCHTYSNTITTINQQVWYLCRHNSRLTQRIVEVANHVNGILFDVVHYMFSHLRKATLGISHSCRRVAVYATKVTLSVNKLVSHVPILSHAHQRTVHRTVTMGVVFTQHFTYYTCTFLVRFVACVSQSQHTV